MQRTNLNNRGRRPSRAAALTAIVAGGLATAALGQGEAAFRSPPGLTQENIVRQAMAQFPEHDVIAFDGVFGPSASSGRHRHPGTEILRVMEGEGVMLRDGREPTALKPGAAYILEPGASGDGFVHELRNTSATQPLKTFVVLLVAKGRPPALPAD